MDQLPELVKSAISAACNSGKSLSWKVQEGNKGILIQLVWKPEPDYNSSSGNTIGVCSNWRGKCRTTKSLSAESRNADSKSSNASQPSKKKRVSPSKARRNARRLQAFLEHKKHTLPVVSQKEPELTTNSESLSVSGAADGDKDLKLYLENEVECVDFSVTVA